MRNILITGGAGFIGSNLANKLIQKGYYVTVLDNLSPQIHGDNPSLTSPLFQSIKGKVRFIYGDVSKREAWIKALEQQDAIIHLAAETGTGQSMYEIDRYVDVNVRGTAILFDILVNTPHTIQKIIIASSRAIYGEGKYKCTKHGIVFPVSRLEADMLHGDFECKCPVCKESLTILPTSEDSKIHPTSIYGLTKQNQEQIAFIVGNSLGIPVIVFRYQNVYGPGQSLSNPYTGILSIFSTRIKNGNAITIFEDGKESRDFVYIDDVTDATILGLENIEVTSEVFNVGTGQSVDVLTVVNTLQDCYISNVEVKITGTFRLGDIRHNIADISKARTILGYTPVYNFPKGIESFCTWVNKQQTYVDNFDKSLITLGKKGLYK